MSPPTLSAPVALTIAGSDSGANAGIQADLLSIAANGVYGVTVLTCVTAQNPDGLTKAEPLDPALVQAQLEQVCVYFRPKAIKTGMLLSPEIVQTVADFLSGLDDARLVVDPVMVSSAGQTLLEPKAIELIQTELLPLATVVTPNLDEAQILVDRPITSEDDMLEAAAELSASYHAWILLKGGHLAGNHLTDVLVSPDGAIQTASQERILSIDTHGSGCTLSAAIAAQLALGQSVPQAIAKAQGYLRRGMEDPLHLGQRPFINHFPR